MPYNKPSVTTERTGLPGTPLGNTGFFIPTVVAKTLGKSTLYARSANTSGDDSNLYVDGVMVTAGETLNYAKVVYTNGTYLTAALPILPVKEVYSVTSNHNNPYEREFVEGIDFTLNKTTGILDFSNAPAILPPSIDLINTVTTGGSIAAGTYNFAITAIDENGKETTAGTLSVVVPAGTATNTISVYWSKIRNCDGYKIYKKVSTGGVTEYETAVSVTSKDTTSYTFTAAISTGLVSLPAANSTKHTPDDSDDVYIYYSYYAYTYNSPKRYFDTETVQQDHGIGSEIANAARLVMGPVATGQGATSMYIVAPQVSTGEVLGFENGIDACESIQELILMSTSSSSDVVNDYLKAHCESMSAVANAKERFCFVSTTSANQVNTDTSVISNKILALNKSNRCHYVLTDGGKPYARMWQNTIDKYNVIDATTKTTAYTENLAVDGQWHAIAVMGAISALSDPATPSTNKQIYGISTGAEGSVAFWSETKKNNWAAVGGMILEDRLGNLFVRHGLTINTDSVEDSESSIVLAEAYMAKRLRDNHQQFIGKKITGSLLSGVTTTVTKTLNALISAQIITSYTSINVYQDTVNPTWVYVTFQYDAVYPCNNIKFQWGFNVAGA